MSAPQANKKQKELEFIAQCSVPTQSGEMFIRAYRNTKKGTEPVAIFFSKPNEDEVVLVRVHDACFTSETLGSQKCDCKQQLDLAIFRIKNEGGVIIYLQQEGRGIGLSNKIAAYALQEKGLDTVDANTQLHFPEDNRTYEDAITILHDLKIKKIRLMTNNPQKIKAIQSSSIDIVERVPILIEATAHSWKYLCSKQQRMGHLLETK